MKTHKFPLEIKSVADFKDIDRHLLVGFECSQFSYDKKRFISMIKEQTISAIHNKKYLSLKS